MKVAQTVNKRFFSRPGFESLERKELCDGNKLGDFGFVEIRTTEGTKKTKEVEDKSIFKESVRSVLEYSLDD